MKCQRSLAVGISSMVCLALVALCSPLQMTSEAATEAKVTLSGDGIELEYTSEDGTTSSLTLPLHKAGAVRYFSAGVGLEEREATYPPFPLKLIFVAGPKAYLSQVAVTITDAKGAVMLEVPAEQVAGPWLYVDLPAGAYTVAASRDGQDQVKGRVTVTK
ncbi:MAG: hypothetical protein HY284_05555, partial [Nitrospirae bacterium]|nr:hypothetical protein [Nitrospirota bacterium]